MELIEKSGHVELVHKDGNWILLRELGFSPVQTVVAATAACSTYVYEEILEKQRIAYKMISVDVDYERNTELTTQPLSKINVQFHILLSSDDQAKAIKDLSLIAKNCPVVQSLNPSIKVDESVTFEKEDQQNNA
jgi:Predicted redox protein, regulator of disulfide bond formation